MFFAVFKLTWKIQQLVHRNCSSLGLSLYGCRLITFGLPHYSVADYVILYCFFLSWNSKNNGFLLNWWYSNWVQVFLLRPITIWKCLVQWKDFKFFFSLSHMFLSEKLYCICILAEVSLNMLPYIFLFYILIGVGSPYTNY